jgi:hypothetical protein
MEHGDWGAYDDPEQLLVYLQRQGHDPAGRKNRLLAVACCRRIWDLLPEAQRRAVELAEQEAEGGEVADEDRVQLEERLEDCEGLDEWGPIRQAVTSAVCSVFIDFRIHRVFAGCAAARAWKAVLDRHPEWAVEHWRLWMLARTPTAVVLQEPAWSLWTAAFRRETLEQCALVEEVYGHLLHRVPVEAGWRTPEVVSLAAAIDQQQRFEDLPILADALEEAGCTDPAILTHLRGPGPHVRGCWPVDMVLAKG